MSTEPYTPDELELIQSHAFFAPARPQDMDVRAKAAERAIAKIKADAVRGFDHEVQRGLDRDHPRLDQEELSTRITLIAEADAYAQRIEEEA